MKHEATVQEPQDGEGDVRQEVMHHPAPYRIVPHAHHKVMRCASWRHARQPPRTTAATQQRHSSTCPRTTTTTTTVQVLHLIRHGEGFHNGECSRLLLGAGGFASGAAATLRAQPSLTLLLRACVRVSATNTHSGRPQVPR
jgi:hypothetical protein